MRAGVPWLTLCALLWSGCRVGWSAGAAARHEGTPEQLLLHVADCPMLEAS